VTDIIIADCVALAKGRSFELTGANFGNIMGQFCPDGFFYLYSLKHGSFSFFMAGWSPVFRLS
jgi:coproporphyrinogen III oxidase